MEQLLNGYAYVYDVRSFSGNYVVLGLLIINSGYLYNYINDIYKISLSLQLFADEYLLYHVILYEEDYSKFQQVLNCIQI